METSRTQTLENSEALRILSQDRELLSVGMRGFALLEKMGAKLIEAIPDAGRTPEILAQLEDEHRHARLVSECAESLASATGSTGAQAELKRRGLRATQRYLLDVQRCIEEPLRTHGFAAPKPADDLDRARIFRARNAVFSLVLERRAFRGYKALGQLTPFGEVRELLGVLVREEEAHLRHARQSLGQEPELEAHRWQDVFDEEDRLAQQWIGELASLREACPGRTALLVPGLDALFSVGKIKRWVDVPTVRESLAEVSASLSKLTGRPEDLEGFMRAAARPHLADFERTLVAMTGIQLGIVRALELRGARWDVVVGVSHGDIARSVLAGCISLDTAVELLWDFARLRKTCPPGRTASVRTVDGSEVSAEHVKWMQDAGGALSLWSRFHGTVSGTQEVIARLCGESRGHGLKIKPLLPYPIHSPVMRTMVEGLLAEGKEWRVSPPNQPILSSVWARELRTSGELMREAVDGAIQPLQWLETLQALTGSGQVTRFINVGPSTTLAEWLPASIAVDDSWEAVTISEHGDFHSSSLGA